mmetsp:Transcript_15575/g.31443  ORF Transcript_15575/g.31443 Transcript_15575/m.31443 type:complete len:1061 (-) Transcript_15575:340-3522(-)
MSFYPPNAGGYGYAPPGNNNNAPPAPGAGNYAGYPPNSAPAGGLPPPGSMPSVGGFAPPAMGGGYGPPGGNAPATSYGAPSTTFNPPGAPAAPASSFPAFRPPGAPAGGPPAGNFAPPGPPVGGAPASAIPGKPAVTFFSTAGGVATPAVAAAPSMMPPPSNMGPPPSGMIPPPSGMGPGGPPMGGPPGGMPPPSGMGGNFGAPAPPPSNFGAPNMAPGVPPSMNMGVPQGGAPYGGGPTGAPYGGAPGGMGGMYGQPNTPQSIGMPSGFDSGGNLAGMHNGPGGAAMPGGAPLPGAAANAAPLPLIDEMDLSIQCNPMFLRSTVSKIVNNQSAATNTRLPIGLVCKPMAGDVGTENDEIEVVDFGATGIVRCKRCRTYINPYVTWADNGRRWRCNICGMQNDVPSTYFSHLDNNGQRRDRDQRPELARCSVEFVAPADYMVRPPQPAVYFFVIDVSEPAIVSGMLHNTARAIKASLDDLPGGDRAQIGFITFDAHIHFYNLSPKLASPHMIVVSDITDVILPLPEDILVNLADSRAVVDALLDSLTSMFKSSNSPSSCTGPALIAAKRVIQHVGGKLLLFQSSLPTIGEGALKMRDNPRLLGSDKEHTMLNAEDTFYKTHAVDFSRVQICIDTFLFAAQYTDVATLSVLSKYTAGSTYFYPAYVAARDGPRYEHDLHHDLTRATAFESVMRVRATRGVRFSNFYGNYFIRGTDLLALPNCTSDSSFSLDMAYDEAVLSAQAITIQAALLYTSAAGERRIRVHTMVIPVTTSVAEMTESLDIDCAMNLLAKQATEIAQKTGMENARQRVSQITVDIMRASRLQPGGGMQQPYGQQAAAPVAIPSCLLLLPLYSMSLQKSAVVRGGNDTRVDERAYFQQLLLNMDIEESKVFIYPRMFSIHDMTTDTGLPSDNADEDCPTAGPNQVRLPSILNLSYERLSSNGIFLLENGHDLFMWMGRAVNPAILNTLFGLNSLEGADMQNLRINPENSDFSSRLDAVITALRADRARYMQLHFIREGDGYAEAYFARYLIEDRANFTGGMSYTEYHAHVTRAVSGMAGH